MKKWFSFLAGLIVVSGIAFGFGELRFKRVYVFPKATASVKIVWEQPPANRNEKGLHYGIYIYNYTNPSIGWSSLGSEDTTFNAQGLLKDSALVYITAIDSVGNESLPSDTVKATYRLAVVVPPPVTPPVGTSDIPLVEVFNKSLSGGKWKVNGPVGVYSRAYDLGTGLYFFEGLGPVPQFDCWASRPVNFTQKGTYELTVWAGTGDTLNTIAISMASQSFVLPIAKKRMIRDAQGNKKIDYSDTLGHPIVAHFIIPAAGVETLKVNPLKSACIQRYQLIGMGAVVDTTPPGRVPMVRVVE